MQPWLVRRVFLTSNNCKSKFDLFTKKNQSYCEIRNTYLFYLEIYVAEPPLHIHQNSGYALAFQNHYEVCSRVILLAENRFYRISIYNEILAIIVILIENVLIWISSFKLRVFAEKLRNFIFFHTLTVMYRKKERKRSCFDVRLLEFSTFEY